MGNFDSISRILTNVEQNPHWQTHQQLRRIRDHWEAIAGETVARHTRPISLQNQQLKIATASNSWSQNLMFERQRLLQKLNRHFKNPPLNPPVQQLHFSTARWSQSQPKPSTQSSQPDDTVAGDDWVQGSGKGDGKGNGEAPGGDRPPQNISTSATDPAQAFQNWAHQIQQQTQTRPPCPVCTAPTPVEELQRWQCCSLCASHQWRTNSPTPANRQ
ncbi:MAG: DciA family protein [Cyanophyceae cyanobacterium]